MSFSGVVEKLEETPSSQERAFWRETPGAAAIMSLPEATDAKALEDTPKSKIDFQADGVVRFSKIDAILQLLSCSVGRMNVLLVEI